MAKALTNEMMEVVIIVIERVDGVINVKRKSQIEKGPEKARLITDEPYMEINDHTIIETGIKIIIPKDH